MINVPKSKKLEQHVNREKYREHLRQVREIKTVNKSDKFIVRAG